jgi:glutathione S-transferase
MDLFFAPMACSLAAHVAALEGEVQLTRVRVNLRTKVTSRGDSLFDRNPMGQVPTLQLDDGSVLAENTAVLQLLADLGGERLAPPWGTPARRLVTQQLGFVTTELHKKVLAMVFNPAAPDAVREFARGEATRPLNVLQQRLERQEFVAGNSFSVADAYLIWALTLLPRAGVPLDGFSAIQSYVERTTSRPAVARALQIEMREQAEPPP